jgi:uncharacterized protein YciI
MKSKKERNKLMKTRLGKITLALMIGLAGMLAAQTPAPNPLTPYIPKNMKPYYLDMLVKGEKDEGSLSEAERGELMQKHLAYIRSQVEAGKFVLVGPLVDDTRIRGIALIQVASREEAQQIASSDPMVQTGYLGAEVHPILLEDLSAIRFDYPSLH